MSGLMSRRKGMRNEYLVRDAFRLQGYEAHRVPASGAAQGFKGDVHVRHGADTFTVEVKARKEAFKELYTYYDEYFDPYKEVINHNGNLITMMKTDPAELLYCYDLSYRAQIFIDADCFKKLRKKLDQVKKMKENCDMIALKDDRKPFLYLRFYKL